MAPKISKKYKSKKIINKTKKLNCSPKKENELNKFSCYTNTALHKLKDLWNTRHTDSQINTNNPKEIWEELKKNMQNLCENEKCWLNQKFAENNLDAELKYYTFAPISPKSWKKNPNEWLSSVDINKIMKQYEKTYPTFSFIGPTPIDFNKKIGFGQCVWNDLCNFDLNKHIKKNKNKIGIIFNTDPHTSEGSHWICIFIDIKNNFIFYFDSNNSYIPKEINKLIKKLIKQGERILESNLNYTKIKLRHQKTRH